LHYTARLGNPQKREFGGSAFAESSRFRCGETEDHGY
jgi:hypothetical protein